MSQNYAASIIVVTFNRRDDLRECLAALPESHLSAHKAEIIVVDDGSTDDIPGLIADEFPHVSLLRNDENRGPSFSRNRAAKAARGDLLCFLDSDAVPKAAWLKTLIANDDGDTVLIGAAHDYEGDRLQSGARRATFIGKSLPCDPAKADTGASCNLALPRARFEAIGGFDEELPYYFEDSDLCIRAKRAGCKAKYLIEAAIRHKGSEIKRGDAVRMQEHNSTYAMLKTYRGAPLALAAFTLANGSWALFRAARYSLRGRTQDARNLLSGWWSAHRRYGGSKRG